MIWSIISKLFGGLSDGWGAHVHGQHHKITCPCYHSLRCLKFRDIIGIASH